MMVMNLTCVQRRSINITVLFACLYIDCSLIVGEHFNKVSIFVFFALKNKSSLDNEKKNYLQ